MKAATQGHPAIVQMLFARGAEADARGNGGGTALLFAASRGVQELIALLFAKKADVNARNDAGLTPLIIAAAYGRVPVAWICWRRRQTQRANDKGFTALIAAANKGLAQTVSSSSRAAPT